MKKKPGKRTEGFNSFLIILVVFTVISFSMGIKEVIVYNSHLKNAVTVTATLGESYVHYRDEVDWIMGAGDDIEKEVNKVSFFSQLLSYTYEGKEYTHSCTSSDLINMGIDLPFEENSNVEIRIDSSDPNYIIHTGPKTVDFYLGLIPLTILVITLSVYQIKKHTIRRQ